MTAGSDWRVARSLRNLVCDFGCVHLGYVQAPDAHIQEPSNPLAIAIRWSHYQGEIQCAREHRHIRDGFHRWRGMLHVHPGVVEPGTFQQRQNGWIAREIDPCADLDAARSDGCMQRIGFDCHGSRGGLDCSHLGGVVMPARARQFAGAARWLPDPDHGSMYGGGYSVLCRMSETGETRIAGP